MTESRPRPQFGEYATPEQQRAAMGLPPEPVVAAEPVAPTPVAMTAPDDPRPRRRWDLVLTIALLVYGLITVISSSASYMNIVPVMSEAMERLGIEGEFTNYAAGRTWGTIAVIVLVVGWTLTALLSVKRLRTGKLTWWVPLVGGAVSLLIASTCLAVPMLGDPAFLEHLNALSRG